MKQTARTRLIYFRPYRHRAEQCSLGIIATREDGSVSVHLGEQLRKAKALDPSCSVESIREGLEALAEEVQDYPQVLKLYEGGVGAIAIGSDEGFFQFEDEESYLAAVRWALAVAVEPQKPLKHAQARATVSRLFIELKSSFSSLGWLATHGESLEDHLIVPRYPLSQEEGLTLDFALQNGVFNCIQTLDYRTNTGHRKVEASAKLLTLGMATSFAPAKKAKRFALIAGGGIDIAQPGIKLAERVADDVFIHESASDMGRLFDVLANAMGQSPMSGLST